MDNETSAPPSAELDIRDQPILDAGVPPEDVDPSPWHGAMLRTVAAVIRQGTPDPSWEQMREALDVVTLCIRDELLPEARGQKPVEFELHPDDAERYLRRPCPPAEASQERQRWARAVGHAVFGIIMSPDPLPPRGAEFDRWWNEMVRGLDSFSAYVRSEGGPLTWTVG